MLKTFIMVWIEEEEKWYYFKEKFDETVFVNGYVDYYIEIDDAKLKYDYHKGKYLLCVTKDGKCISYLVPTDEKGDNYIQNIDDENKYFNK